MGRKPKKKDIAEYLWHSEPTKINATNDNWRIRYGYLDSEGKEHQTTETVNNERAKNQFVSYLLLREKEHKAAKGTTVASKVDKTEIETVEQLLYAYAEHTKYLHTIGDRYGWDEGTYRANIGKIRNYIVPVFGSFPIWKITRVDMRQGFKDMLRLPQANGNHKANGARVSQRTVYDCKKIISRAFKYATDDLELITENPMLGVTVKQPKSSRREVWTEEQFNFAYDNCSDPQLKLLISLMVALSSRIGECLALTWSDVYDNEDKHEPSYIRNYKELTYRTENFIKETNGRGILKVFDQVRSTRPDAKRRAVFHVTKTEKEIEAKTDRIYIAPEVIFMLRDYRLVQNQHMLRKRQTFYLDTNEDGVPMIYEGRVVQARVIGVAEKVLRVEVFGVECTIFARDLSAAWFGDAREYYSVGDRVLVRVLTIDRDDINHISITADIRSVSSTANQSNLDKCVLQGKYAGRVTDVRHGVVFIRLNNGVNAVAHTCYDRRMPGKKDDVSFAVTRLDEERGIAVGIITRIIKQNL